MAPEEMILLDLGGRRKLRDGDGNKCAPRPGLCLGKRPSVVNLTAEGRFRD